MKRIVLEGQSLWDMALQETGDVAGAWDMADRLGISLTDELATGQQLEVAVPLGNKQLAAYYAQNSILPATALAATLTSGEAPLLLEGIDFWGIEYDFIIN